MITPDEQTSPQDPLRSDRCPDCGYRLTGLRPGGPCPECGFAYTEDMIVLYAWPPGTGPSERHWWLLGPLLGLVVLLTAGGIWANRARFFLPHDFAGILTRICALAPTAVLVGMLWLWHRARRDHPSGLLQVRLAPQGFAVRYGFGKVRMKPWTRGHGLRLDRVPGGRYTFCINDGGLPILEFTGGCQLDCDVDAADRIRHRVQTWCDQPKS